MPDDADRAQPWIEHVVEDGLAEIRRRAGNDGLKPVGLCHYCDAIVGPAQLFCDGDCAHAYAHERDLRRAAGVK